MNILDKMNTRWAKEELVKFGSWFRIGYLLCPLIIYYLAGDIVEVLMWAILNSLVKSDIGGISTSLEGSASYTVRAIIYALGLMVSMILLYRMAKNEITYVTNGENKPTLSIKQIVILVIAALIFSNGLNYLFSYSGIIKMSQSYESAADFQYGINIITGVILFGICSPLAEEVIFRGIIYNRLKRVFPLYVSIFLSSVLFGMFHGNLVQALYGTLMGLIITVFYEKYKSFYAPVLIHMVANIGVYVLSYYVNIYSF